MKTNIPVEDLFEKAQKALLNIILARTRKRLPLKRLRAVNENIRLEYLISLINQAELWLDYRTHLKTLLSFDNANLFNGTLAEHCRAVLKACESINPVTIIRKSSKKYSGPIEHSDTLGLSLVESPV